MKNKLIIGLSAKATSGKTLAARTLAAELPGCMVISFAKKLKEKAIEDFGLTQEDVYNNKDKVLEGFNEPITIRQLLIAIGQTYRALDRDFWVKCALGEIENAPKEYQVFVIDDLRFRNEAEKLKKEGACLIRIERPGIPLIDDISEKDLDSYDGFDYFLHNVGTKEEFRDNILESMKWLKNLSRQPEAE